MYTIRLYLIYAQNRKIVPTGAITSIFVEPSKRIEKHYVFSTFFLLSKATKYLLLRWQSHNTRRYFNKHFFKISFAIMSNFFTSSPCIFTISASPKIASTKPALLKSLFTILAANPISLAIPIIHLWLRGCFLIYSNKFIKCY